MGGAILWHHGHIVNKHGRGLLADATNMKALDQAILDKKCCFLN